MPRQEIDPVANAFINGTFSERTELTDADGPDFFRKFLDDAALAGAIGFRGHEHVERLHAQTQDLNRRADEALQKTQAARTSSWEEQITDDSQRLAKVESANDRRKRNLSAWVSSQLALNKSVTELVEHAQRHDPATARLIAEIGEELRAA